MTSTYWSMPSSRRRLSRSLRYSCEEIGIEINLSDKGGDLGLNSLAGNFSGCWAECKGNEQHKRSGNPPRECNLSNCCRCAPALAAAAQPTEPTGAQPPDRGVGSCLNVAKQLTGLISRSYSRCDGSLRGLNGNAGIGRPSLVFANQAAAAPATVSGESVVECHWVLGPGRRRQIAIREPGDLPSAVVTREHIDRGVSVGA